MTEQTIQSTLLNEGERRPSGRRSPWYWLGLTIMAAGYTAAGILHFLRPAVYIAIMPPSLPYPRALVYLSGAAEIAGGLGLLPTRTRRAAAWGLAALLIAVFPANVTMLQRHAEYPQIPLWALWLRLPLQLPLIAWAWHYTRNEPDKNRAKNPPL